jgi:hypothetical protein
MDPAKALIKVFHCIPARFVIEVAGSLESAHHVGSHCVLDLLKLVSYKSVPWCQHTAVKMIT